MLKLVNISKRIGLEYLLKDINIELKKGRITAIISLNLAETTSLLKIISGNIIPSSGKITIDDKTFNKHSFQKKANKKIASSFELENIFPNLSIIDNTFLNNLKKVSFLGVLRRNKAIKLAMPLFHEFSLPIAWGKKVETLSIEEKGALSIARLMLFDLDYYLMDRIAENITIPCYNKLEEKCLELKNNNKSVVFVPNNVNQIFDFCDEVIVLRNGEVAFYSEVSQTNIEEIYNIMNNRQYAINQAIINKYNQFQKNIRAVDELANRTLKLIENFCNIKDVFCCYLDEKNSLNVNFSKNFVKDEKEVISKQYNNIFKEIKNSTSSSLKVKIGKKEYYIYKIEYKDNLYAILGFIKKAEKNIETLLKIIEELSYSVYYINQEILKEIEHKKREYENIQMKNEMNIAKKIQLALIPAGYESKVYEISAKMLPAEEVGGDYYDYLNVIGDITWLGIGDVTGHGLTSGLIMMMAQTAFNTILLSNPNISSSELIVQANRVIYNNVRNRMFEEHFMTISILCADKNGLVTYAGAHLDILIYRNKTGKVDIIPTIGMWIGLLPEIGDKLNDKKFVLNKDDVMILYTDGIIEAMDKEKNLYGLRRFEEKFKSVAKNDVDKIRDELIEDVLNYLNRQDDDITLVVVKKK